MSPIVASRSYYGQVVGYATLHFSLTGALEFVSNRSDEPPFIRVRFDFEDDGSLAYTNRRMLGRVGLADDAGEFVADQKLGPDALDARIDFDAFKSAVGGTSRDVKSVLMDQAVIAGIGNIYSDEILFQARIDPRKRMDELAPRELKRLFVSMREVLESAIARGIGALLRAPAEGLSSRVNVGSCGSRPTRMPLDKRSLFTSADANGFGTLPMTWFVAVSVR
jgi:formamidopyrimidine-DNA glycosylase